MMVDAFFKRCDLEYRIDIQCERLFDRAFDFDGPRTRA
jgi:hypothetical protein